MIWGWSGWSVGAWCRTTCVIQETQDACCRCAISVSFRGHSWGLLQLMAGHYLGLLAKVTYSLTPAYFSPQMLEVLSNFHVKPLKGLVPALGRFLIQQVASWVTFRNLWKLFCRFPRLLLQFWAVSRLVLKCEHFQPLMKVFFFLLNCTCRTSMI